MGTDVEDIDDSAAQALALQPSANFTMPDLAPPSSKCIWLFLERVRNSAPGIDGIPYRDWLRAGPYDFLLLHKVAVSLFSGFEIVTGFNDALFIFVAKGLESAADEVVIR